MSAVANPATVDECLRVGAGFSQGDRNWIAEQFGTLAARLAAFHADTTELEVSVKDREARGQKVTLECWIAGRQKVVTTSSEARTGVPFSCTDFKSMGSNLAIQVRSSEP